MQIKSLLDCTLVPLGLVTMMSYHLWLLFQILNHPSRTTIGINAINRRFWVRAMMNDTSKNGVLAVQTLRNNIMASTLLASTAIMLSSLIAMLMVGNKSGDSRLVLVMMGDTSDKVLSLKFFSILLCFLLAFLLTVQSIRYYSHASLLINVPVKETCHRRMMISGGDHPHHLSVDYVVRTVNRGGYFWSLGLRAFYFSLPLFMWIFGPVPMFLCCVVLVALLYFLDITLEYYVAVAADAAPGESEDGGHVLMNHHNHDCPKLAPCQQV